MAHLLMIEAPGGNDFDLLTAALANGHQVSFVTADFNHYQQNATLKPYLDQIDRVLEIKPFSYPQLEQAVLALHQQQSIDAVLCLIDIRIIEAAKLAERLSLRFVNSETATVMRDKFTVRTILAEHGIRQPAFALATDNQQLRAVIENMGLPVLVKPCDGYGSQNIATFLTADDLNPFIDPLDDYLPCRTDYGFGVNANDRLLVERYISGQLIGCDTFTRDGQHLMLGINEKLMFPAPSCAIKGSCFPSDCADIAKIEAYVFSILNALNFNDGVTHTEILLTEDGPLLVEVNPRLVGAKIPRLLNLALGRSVHSDLINLHLGNELELLGEDRTKGFAISRWIISTQNGVLDQVVLPDLIDPAIKHVEILKKSGDQIGYPYQNADRLGYIMVLGETRSQAEQIANQFIDQVKIQLNS